MKQYCTLQLQLIEKLAEYRYHSTLDDALEKAAEEFVSKNAVSLAAKFHEEYFKQDCDRDNLVEYFFERYIK